MAVRAYNSPGVSVTETISPSLAPLLANPSTICIVGAASGEQSATERLILSGVTEYTLRNTGIDTGSVVVKLASTNEVLDNANWDLTAGTDPDATVTGDEPFTISRVPSPSVAPVVANTGTGALNGVYVYAVSYVNPDGTTGIGPASSPTTFNGTQGADLTGIPVDASSGNNTSARNVYRAKVVGGITGPFHLVATIGNNSATTLDDEATIDAVADAAATPVTGIADGDTVIVSYDYTDQNYYQPTIFDDYDDIVDKYGEPFDSDGNIDSKLSFAARLAFQNGASEIVALAALSDSDSDLEDSFSKLEDDSSIRIIAVASASPAVHAALAAHVANMNSIGLYRQAVVGRDGSSVAIPAATLRAAAEAYNNEAVIYVSPANFVLQNPITGRDTNVGGHWASAGVAGMFAARDVQVPLTRKTLAGFSGLGDRRTSIEQALDSAAGLFVILDKGGVLQVRHQVTTAVQNINTAEASVVRAKYDMAHRLRDALDGSIVGQVLPETDAPLAVQSVVSGILEQMVLEGAISSYGNVKARLLDTDATTIEARFEYRPAFPINNVIVRFTINSSSGDFTIV